MSEILSLCVEFLNRYGESFWSFASGMFVQVTVLVLALLVLELLLRNRVRAVVRYAVWLLVLVKLVLPVDLRSPASVAYWLPTGHAGNSEPLDQTLDARLAGPAVDRDPAFADRLERTEPTPGASAPTHETAAVSDLKSSGPLMPMPPIAAAVPPTPLHWRGVIFGIWILAVVALLAMVGKRALWVRRIVRQATDAARELEDQLHECLSLMGMKRRQVAIKTTDRLGSPAICGLWRPTILLPRGFPGGLDREQIRMVFVHELVHWRRGDLQVNCFQTLFQILYFYSPAVWIANLYIRRLREQAVDETVLVALHGQSERYAATLLDIASATLQPAEAMLRLIGVVESRRAVSTRIRHILQRPTPRTAKLGLTGLAVIAASGLLLLPMGQRDRAATADDRSDAKASATSDHRDSESKDASKTEPAGQPKGTDVDGDPLPVGAIARLGTKRFRSDCRPVALTYLADGKTLAQIASDTSHAWLQHWDANSGRLLDEKALSNHVFFARAASPAGNLVAIYNSHIDDDRNESIESVRLLNLSSGERVFDIKIQERHSEHLTLSPNARFLAYSGSLAGRGEMLHLIDTGTQAELISRKIDDRVESMAFSPDGQMLGIGVYSGKLLLWNWSGKEEPRSINLPQDNGTYPVGPLVFSTEGTTVAVVNGNRDFKGVPLIDTASGRIVRTFVVPEFEHHNSRTLVFSPDGTRLAATTVETSGGGVALWDVLTGKPVRHLSGMFGEPYYLAFSPDGRQLAASSEWDSTMCVWNLETGQPRGTDLAVHLKPPNSIRFLPGDKELVTAGDDETIRIWNLADSRQERTMRHVRDQSTHSSSIRGMDVSPDGKYIVSSSFDDTVRLWETDSGREVYRLPGHGNVGAYRAIQFTPDAKRLASWGDDMRVYLWDVATGKAVQEFIARPAGLKMDRDELGNPPFSGPLGLRIEAACFSPDASELALYLDGVRRFSLRTGEELPRIDCRGGQASRIVISPDNRYLFWNAIGKSERGALKDGSGRRMVTQNHPVELRSLPDGKLIKKLDLPGKWDDVMTFSPDSSLVAMAVIDDPYRIELRKIPDLFEVARIDLPSRAWALEFSHSGKLLAASVSDSTVLVWDLDHIRNKKSP